MLEAPLRIGWNIDEDHAVLALFVHFCEEGSKPKNLTMSHIFTVTEGLGN